MEQLGYHWTDFYEILYLSVFQKSAEKMQFAFISDQTIGYFT